MKNLEIEDFGMENEVNLCGSCCHIYPNCTDDNINIIFGTNKGGDNICSCNKYEALSFRDQSNNGEL